MPSDAYMRQKITLWFVVLPSHYMSQCWIIVNFTLINKLKCIFIEKSDISVKKMHLKMLFENGGGIFSASSRKSSDTSK